MKRTIFTTALLTVGCFSLPTFAQQQDLQEVMNAANALSARENELQGKKDAAGIDHCSHQIDFARPAVRIQAWARRHTEALSRDH